MESKPGKVFLPHPVCSCNKKIVAILMASDFEGVSMPANHPSVPLSSLPDDALVRLDSALALTGWRKTQFYKRIREGLIPGPVRLGPRAKAWRMGDLRQYLQGLSQASGQ